jgi:carbonic anhydrase
VKSAVALTHAITRKIASRWRLLRVFFSVEARWTTVLMLFCRTPNRAAGVALAPGICPQGYHIMSDLLHEVLAANDAYAAKFGDKGKLALPPARRFAILTCMDARLDPAKFAGLAEGDAHVIRNAGGRASDDAIRSLVISSKLLGTHEWFVIHHTDCGMQLFDDEIMGDLLEHSLETARLDKDGWRDVGQGPGSVHGKFVKWHTFTDLARSVVEDVARIRSHPLVRGDIPIYGYIYDVKNGRLTEVKEASKLGLAA